MIVTEPGLLQRLAAALFAAERVPQADSARVAETLVASDLWGTRATG
jgi:LDH2 family malate/lactate/ureidoglycolate dehydrogenase